MWMYKGEERNGMDRWCYLIFLVLLLFDTITSEVTGTRQYWCITIFDFFHLLLLVLKLISTLLRIKCERDRSGCPARTNTLEVRLENACCGMSKMQLIFSRVTTSGLRHN